jgi:membrane associated rhomboid family serine protease
MSITLAIIIITAAISLIGFSNTTFSLKLIFTPYRTIHFNEWWRIVSCGLLHADFFHLFINMFVLYSFGQAVEYYYHFAFGNVSGAMFVLLYISSIAAANVSTLLKHQNSLNYKSLGASGAVSAIVFTSILFNPYAKIYLYGIIGLPGILLGIAYLIYSYYMSKRGDDNINHEAHFYGAVYGMLFTVVFKPVLFLHFIKQLMSF